MLLSDKTIYQLFAKKEVLVTPLGKDAIQPCSVDIRMGSQLHKQVKRGYPVTNTMAPEFQSLPSRVRNRFVLYPGEFYLASSMETVKVSDGYAMKLEGKSSWGRRGLEVHSTAGWVDPGFEGELTFEMKVVGVDPVEVGVGDYIAQLCIFQLDNPAIRPYGHTSRASKYQNQKGPTGPRMIGARA